MNTNKALIKNTPSASQVTSMSLQDLIKKPTTTIKRVKRATIDGSGNDRAMISFRGDIKVIESLKLRAKSKNWPYQAEMRRILKEYVEAHPMPAEPSAKTR